MEKEQERLLAYAWAILANVSDGDWDKQTKEWQDVASKWRNSYGKLLRKSTSKEEVEDEI